MPCTHIPLWFLNCLTLIECVFFLWCRWGTACLWGSGGSAVSKTPLSTATSDKGDLAGLPPRSPPLPSEVCVLELQLGRLLPSLVFLVVPRPGSYSGAITDSLINTFIFTWPAANIVPAFNLPFGPFLSFGDLSADNVWWPLRNPPVTMATEGRLAGQALEFLQPNIVYRTRLNVCVCVFFLCVIIFRVGVKFIVGERGCPIPEEDREDPYSCTLLNFTEPGTEKEKHLVFLSQRAARGFVTK